MFVGKLDIPVVGKKGGNENFAVDCRLLEQRFEKEGWYKISTAYYFHKFFQVFCLFIASWLCVVLGHKHEIISLQMTGGVLVGLFWQQVNFIGHDAGHGTVFFKIEN